MRRWLHLLLLAGCSSSEATTTTPTPTDAGVEEPPADAATDTTAVDAAPALDGSCVVPQGFGDELTAGFGRIDGVLTSIQMPDDQSCTMPNRDHLILQVRMNGAIYRLVVNTDVKVLAIDHALPAPAFAEGWHQSILLDYPSDLGVKSTAFTDPGDMAATVKETIAAGLKVGDKVSVYGTSGDGRPESAHLVHRNVNKEDGAIVVHPDGASPKMVLFAFDNQTF